MPTLEIRHVSSATICLLQLTVSIRCYGRACCGRQERLLYPEGRFEETADHYVGVAASHMDKIGVTLLWIHAKDDPVRCEHDGQGNTAA